MQAKFGWLLLPPAIALLVFLGPLGGSTNTPTTNTRVSAARTAAASAPTLGQIASTLVGVLLLGGVGIVAFAKLRDRQASAGSGPATLRQSLRVSPRHSVHVVEFDNRLLLLGECEGQITVLDGAADPAVHVDERHVVSRDDDDEGAVPRDLLIPRATPTSTPSRPNRSAAVVGAKRKTPDFRSLLELARPRARP